MSGASATVVEVMGAFLHMVSHPQGSKPRLIHVVAEGLSAAREGESQCTRTFQTSVWITCAVVPLAKASHKAKSRCQGWRNRLCLLMGQRSFKAALQRGMPYPHGEEFAGSLQSTTASELNGHFQAPPRTCWQCCHVLISLQWNHFHLKGKTEIKPQT